MISSLLPFHQNGSNFRALICFSPLLSLHFLHLFACGGEAKTYYPPEGWSTVSLYQKDVMREAGLGHEEFSVATRVKLQRVDDKDACREPCHLLFILSI